MGGFPDLATGKLTLFALYLGNTTVKMSQKKKKKEEGGWLIIEMLSVISTHFSSGRETEVWWDY